MPDAEMTGSAAFQRILGGAFMAMASEVSHPDAVKRRFCF